MKIYLVYKQKYADFENGEDDEVLIEGAFKSKKKALKVAKSLANQAKNNNLYIDEDIVNKRNPFKHNDWVDFYRESEDQTFRVSSIVLEELKLVS